MGSELAPREVNGRLPLRLTKEQRRGYSPPTVADLRLSKVALVAFSRLGRIGSRQPRHDDLYYGPRVIKQVLPA